MSRIIKLKKGLDIKIKGKAEKELVNAVKIDLVAIKPTDFHGLTPKLTVKVDDVVRAGAPLFFDKNRPAIVFTSPVSGKVVEINRGERRKILEIVVESDNNFDYEKFDVGEAAQLNRDKVKDLLLKSGLWPFVIQRPYNIIANPENTPKAIFISGFDSAPLAPDYDFIFQNDKENFQTGIDALKHLTEGNINLSLDADSEVSGIFKDINNVTTHKFSGHHPVGNVGVQIHHIDPINKGDLIWTINPFGVIMIGRLIKKGILDAAKIIALTGSEITNPKYYKTIAGASVQSIVENSLKSENVRIISGNVFTGTKIEKSGYLSFYDNQITVIPEGDHHEFFGWIMPGFKKFSISKTYFSWLTPKKEYNLHTNLHGGERSFVFTDQYDKVFPMDILPVYLLKAIIVEDIDKMEELGIYEVAPEDFGLCEFVCTSKINSQSIIQKGIDLMIKELS